MGGSSATKVVQITNIAPQCTKDQMHSLFGNIGKIDEIRLYPTIRDVSCPVSSRICYVKFYEGSCAIVAQHLTNTVFIDRALIVIPIQSGIIPDEYRALEMSNNGTIVPGLHSTDSNLPPEVVNKLEGTGSNQIISTIDPKIDEAGLPEYPPLPVTFDARKIEETRRTVVVYDVLPDWKLEDLMEYFGTVGEIKYGRFAENNAIKYAMIEFTEQKTILKAMKLHGTEFNGVELSVYHATQPIVKPEAKTNEAAQKEIEEAMSIVKEAQSLISAAIDPVIGMLSKDKGSSSRRRSRSRSSHRRRSRSRSKRSRSPRKRSRSRTRKSRSKSKSRSHSKRSPSRSKSKRSPSQRKRSPSDRKRSPSHTKRSKSRDRRRRSRSRSSKRTTSRPRSRSPHIRKGNSRDSERDRQRDRDRKTSSRSYRKDDRSRRSRSRSGSKSKRRSSSRNRSTRKESSRSSKRGKTPDSKKMKRISEEKLLRDYDAEEKIGLEEISKNIEKEKKSVSPEKSDNMDISNSP